MTEEFDFSAFNMPGWTNCNSSKLNILPTHTTFPKVIFKFYIGTEFYALSLFNFNVLDLVTASL